MWKLSTKYLMMNSKLLRVCLILLMAMMITGFFPLARGTAEVGENGIVIHPLSLENRKKARKQILVEFMQKYKENQVFPQIREYMNAKFVELRKSRNPRPPEVVIEDAFDNTRNLMERTKTVVGDKFTREYDPVQIDKKVHHYLWLKGICFLVLGIGEEHKVAVSYFYLPGNEALKKEFLKDVVRYSFPEVPDVQENRIWREQMTAVMEKLGYEIFSVRKYIGNEPETNPGDNE